MFRNKYNIMEDYRNAEVLHRLYDENGMSLERIARLSNRSYSTIQYWMRKNGIARKKQTIYRIPRGALRKLYYDKKLGTTQISKIFGCNEETVRKKMVRFGIPRRTNSESKTKYPKTDFGKDGLERSFLLGFRTGDLHVRKNHALVRVSGTSTHYEFVKLFRRLFEKYGHISVKERFHRGMKEWLMTCDLNKSFEFLMEKPKRVPDEILANNGLFFSFLAGYSDAEGSWVITDNGRGGIRYRLSIGSQDRGILVDIKSKLEELGFNPLFYLKSRAGTKVGFGAYKKDYYSLILARNGDVKRLAAILKDGSMHFEKIQKIKLVLYEERKWVEMKDILDSMRSNLKASEQ